MSLISKPENSILAGIRISWTLVKANASVLHDFSTRLIKKETQCIIGKGAMPYAASVTGNPEQKSKDLSLWPDKYKTISTISIYSEKLFGSAEIRQISSPAMDNFDKKQHINTQASPIDA